MAIVVREVVKNTQVGWTKQYIGSATITLSYLWSRRRQNEQLTCTIGKWIIRAISEKRCARVNATFTVCCSNNKAVRQCSQKPLAARLPSQQSQNHVKETIAVASAVHELPVFDKISYPPASSAWQKEWQLVFFWNLRQHAFPWHLMIDVVSFWVKQQTDQQQIECVCFLSTLTDPHIWIRRGLTREHS